MKTKRSIWPRPARWAVFLFLGTAVAWPGPIRMAAPPDTGMWNLKKGVPMQLSSPAFLTGKDIPLKYSCNGEDLSPPLTWTEPPPGTQSLVLICDDPDAPAGDWVHWILVNIDSTVNALPEGLSVSRDLPGAVPGRTDFRREVYGGPCPPAGPKHRYFFRLFALDCKLALRAGCIKQEVLKAMEGHILGQGELMGKFGR